ncbi:hypothetical protein M8J77_007260 [Diaphorina citri]|nr:hypothetical protein M8J77_007260 [Diaphorina citri]
MKSVWRYLCDGKYKIAQNDRQILYNQFKNWTDSKTEAEFGERCEKLITNAKEYPHFIKYLKTYEKKDWAMHCRESLMIRNNHTNNYSYSEASMRIRKDKILLRTKAFVTVRV